MPPPDRAAEPRFIALQRAFTRHLRAPADCPAPGVHEARRLAIYEHAIFANVAGLMSDNYPRLRAIYSESEWTALLRDYIIRHQSRASVFVDVPKEFLLYLEHERRAADDPPFVYELAHFDWLETLVGADLRRHDEVDYDADGDLLDGCPLANPILQMVTYQFPVHAIDANYQPLQPPAQPTRIAAFRAPDLTYGFLDLNVAAARLLETVIAQTTLTGREIIAATAADIGHPDPAALREPGRDMLERMRARGAILGVRRAQSM